jgi:hypothetical protein
MYLKNGTVGKDSIILVQDRKKVKTEINLRVSQNRVNLLTSCGNMSFSSKIISFGVS